ncbi:hypothetical protein SAY87_008869 [Trapa incisa]|uniref:NPH3 domain-containing protein n=1 Tax=Trapa incisa TaxID=236973 RepID=A0AAN7JXU2_9MYRT|nr:hypothetical protein SAY87_008869 [Trapa incisa]
MKFMKLGTRPDTFYTEQATRTVESDTPADLILQVNNVTYLLHKFPLLPKCGLLQHLCSSSHEKESILIELNDIPGGEDAFELCAKYCYGITINLSANNFLPALCAAKFLRMTESVDKGNFILKQEAFFSSCILEGWKDSIIILQATIKLPELSEDLGIVRRCIDSIVEKILTPPTKVLWSYTYTRPGYNKNNRPSVPRDWWTEDISDLDIDLFRCIIIAIRTTNMLPPQLIGEALHVYASRWLPDTRSIMSMECFMSEPRGTKERNRRALESIVSMVPPEQGSVSVGFLLRLLSVGNFLGVSTATKTELLRRSCQQLEEAAVDDLIFPKYSSSVECQYNIELVLAVVESYCMLWRRQFAGKYEDDQPLSSIRKVARVIDSYLQVISKDVNLQVSKVVAIAEALPDIARPLHDELYRAINTYLKVHPNLEKANKKWLCRILNCQKLSPEVRAHAVKNERLPLRTVVRVFFFDQEKGPRSSTPLEILSKRKQNMAAGDDQPPEAEGRTNKVAPHRSRGGDNKDHVKTETLASELEKKLAIVEAEEACTCPKGKEAMEQRRMTMQNLEPTSNMSIGRSRSERSSNRGRNCR